MKKVVWKFPLELSPYCEINIPKGAQILSVQGQFDEPMLWALVDPDAEKEVRRFAIIETGAEIPEVILSGIKCHIETFQVHAGNYVFHVFELLNEQEAGEQNQSTQNK